MYPGLKDMDAPQKPQEDPEAPGMSEMNDLDEGFIRVLEDLIDTLLANGTLRLTDLPFQALEKLEQRKATRLRIRDANSLINDDEELI